MNLKRNHLETRMVLDLDTMSGYAFRGSVEQCDPSSEPVAAERVTAGFIAGNWGRPSRIYRFVTDFWEPVGLRG